MMELSATSICKSCDVQVEMERVSYPKIRALAPSYKGNTIGSLKVSTEGNIEDGRCITCRTESGRGRLVDDWALRLNQRLSVMRELGLRHGIFYR